MPWLQNAHNVSQAGFRGCHRSKLLCLSHSFFFQMQVFSAIFLLYSTLSDLMWWTTVYHLEILDFELHTLEDRTFGCSPSGRGWRYYVCKESDPSTWWTEGWTMVDMVIPRMLFFSTSRNLENYTSLPLCWMSCFGQRKVKYFTPRQKNLKSICHSPWLLLPCLGNYGDMRGNDDIVKGMGLWVRTMSRAPLLT